jgi:hypothetical protein
MAKMGAQLWWQRLISPARDLITNHGSTNLANEHFLIARSDRNIRVENRHVYDLVGYSPADNEQYD